MKPTGLYVCNASEAEKTISIEIIAKTPGTTCSLVLTKEQAEELVYDLMNQVIKINNSDLGANKWPS